MHIRAIAEAPKANQIPNNKAPEKIEDKKGNRTNDVPRDWTILSNHPKNQISGKTTYPACTHSFFCNICANLAFLFQVEPKYVKEDKFNENWILSVLEELKQFEETRFGT